MTTITDGILTVGASISTTVVLLLIVRRFLPRKIDPKEVNEIAGLCINVVGTLNTLILAFMLLAVWNRFEQAKTTTEQEATELIAAYRLTNGLNDSNRIPLRHLLYDYAESAMTNEWPAMAKGRTSQQTRSITDHIWNYLLRMKSASEHENTIAEKLLDRFEAVSEARSTRLVLSRTGLPGALWTVMLVGSLLTISASCCYWFEHLAVQILNASIMTAMIALVLFTIRLIDGPFQGDVSVRPEGLAHAIEYFNASGQQEYLSRVNTGDHTPFDSTD